MYAVTYLRANGTVASTTAAVGVTSAGVLATSDPLTLTAVSNSTAVELTLAGAGCPPGLTHRRLELYFAALGNVEQFAASSGTASNLFRPVPGSLQTLDCATTALGLPALNPYTYYDAVLTSVFDDGSFASRDVVFATDYSVPKTPPLAISSIAQVATQTSLVLIVMPSSPPVDRVQALVWTFVDPVDNRSFVREGVFVGSSVNAGVLTRDPRFRTSLLGDLTPGTTYTVTVRERTIHGALGPVSAPATVSTLADVQSAPHVDLAFPGNSTSGVAVTVQQAPRAYSPIRRYELVVLGPDQSTLLFSSNCTVGDPCAASDPILFAVPRALAGQGNFARARIVNDVGASAWSLLLGIQAPPSAGESSNSSSSLSTPLIAVIVVVSVLALLLLIGLLLLTRRHRRQREFIVPAWDPAWQIPRKALRMKQVLGEGFFGTVCLLCQPSPLTPRSLAHSFRAAKSKKFTPSFNLLSIPQFSHSPLAPPPPLTPR